MSFLGKLYRYNIWNNLRFKGYLKVRRGRSCYCMYLKYIIVKFGFRAVII